MAASWRAARLKEWSLCNNTSGLYQAVAQAGAKIHLPKDEGKAPDFRPGDERGCGLSRL